MFAFSELLSSEQVFSIPAMQVVLFMAVNSVCLLLGRFKLGLLVSYCFAFYWGLVFNADHFMDLWGEATATEGLAVYWLCGAAMQVVAVAGFFKDD